MSDIPFRFTIHYASQELAPELNDLNSLQEGLLSDLLMVDASPEEVMSLAEQFCQSKVNRILETLTTTDWEYWYQVVCRAKETWHQAKMNQIESCSECGELYKHKDLNYVHRLSNGYSAGRCCQSCQDKLDDLYLRECSYCGRNYDAPNSFNHKWAGLCPHCLSDARLKKERPRLSVNLKRAIDAGTPATLTLKEWVETIDHFGGLCAYCQKRPFTDMEHFIPIGQGGGTTIDNCVPACSECNRAKGKIVIDDNQFGFWDYRPYEQVKSYLQSAAA